MNWPNKIHILEPVYRNNKKEYWDFKVRQANMEKWCIDNLSSQGVLWEYREGMNYVDFYFAQSQDAVMFRLVNGI